MTMEYIPIDTALCKAVSLRFLGFEQQLKLFGFNLGVGITTPPIEFQFPPKILSDGRKAEWSDKGELPGVNPVAVFAKSGAREFTLSFSYIVDNGRWTTTKISNLVRTLRGYFVRSALDNSNSQNNMIAMFKMWRHGGEKEMSCRLNNISIKHSETVVVPCNGSGSAVSLAYPLRTDITIDMRIWSAGGPPADKGLFQNVPGVITPEPVDWY